MIRPSNDSPAWEHRLLTLLGMAAALIAVTGCERPVTYGGQASTLSGSIRLELEETFGARNDEEEGILAYINAVQVDADGRVYVLDADPRSTSQLMSFSPDGRLRWVLDKEGGGPGDLRHVLGFAWDGDSTLYLANQFGTRIDRFTLDGVYIDSKKTAELGHERLFIAGFLASGALVAWKTVSGEFGAKIAVIDPDGDWAVTDTFSVIQTGDHDVPQVIVSPPVITTMGDAIVMGSVTEYQYTWYARSGDRLRRITRDDVELPPPLIWSSGLGVSIREFSRMYPLVEIAENRVVGGGTWPTNLENPEAFRLLTGEPPDLEMANKLDVFDAGSSALLYSLDAERYGIVRLLASDRRGNIYAELAGQAPLLGRFRLEISSSEPR